MCDFLIVHREVKMKKYSFRMILALAAALLLTACGPSEEEQQKAADAAAAAAKVAAEKAALVLPTDVNDKASWQKYLVAQVTKFIRENQSIVKTSHPYMYYIPPGDGDDAKSARNDQLSNVQTTVARGVLPGNMMCFGGPDSNLTADLILDSFNDAKDGSFKGVIVLFVGAQADSDRVKAVIDKIGADYHFVEMK
jgi:hypothetical protein